MHILTHKSIKIRLLLRIKKISVRLKKKENKTNKIHIKKKPKQIIY